MRVGDEGECRVVKRQKSDCLAPGRLADSAMVQVYLGTTIHSSKDALTRRENIRQDRKHAALSK